MIPRGQRTGLKPRAEAADDVFGDAVVGEHSVGSEASPEGLVERTEERMPA